MGVSGSTSSNSSDAADSNNCCLQLSRLFDDGSSRGNNTRNRNILFYSNEYRSKPDRVTIETMLSKWFGNYDLLEHRHGYIQWLFPTPEDGANPKAQKLAYDEIPWLRETPAAQSRLLRAYELMLNFYGLVLRDRDSGELQRADNWQHRFDNLVRNSHNDRRITRIISCMCLLGYEHLMTSFVQFLANEIYREHTLTRCRTSCEQFWVPALPPESRDFTRQYINSLQQQ